MQLWDLWDSTSHPHHPHELPPPFVSVLHHPAPQLMCRQRGDRCSSSGAAREQERKQLLQPAPCTVRTGESASSNEQRDTAMREAQLSPCAAAGACLSSLLPAPLGMKGMEAQRCPQLPATGCGRPAVWPLLTPGTARARDRETDKATRHQRQCARSSGPGENKLCHYSMGCPSPAGSLSVTAERLQHSTCIFMPSRPSLWRREHRAAAQAQ